MASAVLKHPSRFLNLTPEAEARRADAERKRTRRAAGVEPKDTRERDTTDRHSGLPCCGRRRASCECFTKGTGLEV